MLIVIYKSPLHRGKILTTSISKTLFINKSIDQLLEDLNSIKENQNETVSQFYKDSRILSIIQSSELDDTLLRGRLLMINGMSFNRLVYHTHPQISQMLRCIQFDNINCSFTAAVAEEKGLRLNINHNCNFFQQKPHITFHEFFKRT